MQEVEEEEEEEEDLQHFWPPARLINCVLPTCAIEFTCGL